MAVTGVSARLRNTSTATRWVVAGALFAALLLAAFVAYEQHNYAEGYAYGKRKEIVSTHVFDGERPDEVSDSARYESLAEQECAQHSVADGVTDASPRWLAGCVDAVLGR